MLNLEILQMCEPDLPKVKFPASLQLEHSQSDGLMWDFDSEVSKWKKGLHVELGLLVTKTAKLFAFRSGCEDGSLAQKRHPWTGSSSKQLCLGSMTW